MFKFLFFQRWDIEILMTNFTQNIPIIVTNADMNTS